MKAIIQKKLYKRGEAVFSHPDVKAKFIVCSSPSSSSHREEEILALAKQHSASCLVLDSQPFSDAFFHAFASLSHLSNGGLVCRYGRGYNNIPLSLCTNLGVYVAHTTSPSISRAVVQQVIGFMLCISRSIVASHQDLQQGVWHRREGSDLHQKTLAIIGLGGIGYQLAHAAKNAFDMKVIAYVKPTVQAETIDKKLIDRTTDNLEDILPNADFVSLHLPLNSETFAIADANFFSKMKKNAIFINTSRGDLVDIDALYRALFLKHIAAAAIDVFKKEPYTTHQVETFYCSATDNNDNHKKINVADLDNLLITPHLSANTKEANLDMAQETLVNIENFYLGNLNAVNLVPTSKQHYKSSTSVSKVS